MNLRIPGPTPVPSSVLQAMTKPMVNHRGEEFANLIVSVTERLKYFFQTSNDIFIFPSSGTGGMEAAVVNTLSPGDKALVVSIGSFGDRFATIAQRFGAEVAKLDFEWGKDADPAAIAAKLDEDPSIKAVLVTHNETSTGVTNDLEAIARVVRPHKAILVVDSISAIGALELKVDEWGCDVVVTGSQKSWMIPPGLSFVSVSPKGWEAYAQAKMPRYYWDFGSAKKYLDKKQNPYTPAVSLYYALDEALRLMMEETREGVLARHKRLGSYFRNGVRELGLSILAEERCASNTVTAIPMPNGIHPKELRRILREEFDIIVAGGQGKLEDKIFRVGHVGYVTKEDLDDVLNALRVVLPRLGFQTKA